MNNTIPGAATQIDVMLSGDTVAGALGLDSGSSWYAYDFWDDTYLGKFTDTLPVNLRSGEAKMIALHRVAATPQFVATNRHIMQGFVDLTDVSWNAATMTLSGKAQVIGGEPYVMTLALNGYRAQSVQPSGAGLTQAAGVSDVEQLTLTSAGDATVSWSVTVTK